MLRSVANAIGIGGQRIFLRKSNRFKELSLYCCGWSLPQLLAVLLFSMTANLANCVTARNLRPKLCRVIGSIVALVPAFPACLLSTPHRIEKGTGGSGFMLPTRAQYSTAYGLHGDHVSDSVPFSMHTGYASEPLIFSQNKKALTSILRGLANGRGRKMKISAFVSPVCCHR